MSTFFAFFWSLPEPTRLTLMGTALIGMAVVLRKILLPPTVKADATAK